MLFVGIMARLHLYVNRQEGVGYFPGAKTVISSGFRRPFVSNNTKSEDFFSANFSLANAHLAERSLIGPNLYIDNSIIQLLSYDLFARNILRFAHFTFKEVPFDCFGNHDDAFVASREAIILEPLRIQLFRKEYIFRNLNPSPLSYLQNLPLIAPYLKHEQKVILDNIYYKHLFHAIECGPGKTDGNFNKPPLSFIYNMRYDIEKEVCIFTEFLSTGRSATKDSKDEKKLLSSFSLDNAPIDDDRVKRLKEKLNETVEVDILQMSIEENKATIFQFDEEMLSGFMLMLKGDIEILDYKNEDKTENKYP
jgi:hypothetical protein